MPVALSKGALATLMIASIILVSHSCRDEHPELCEAIAAADLCNHPGLTLETNNECRRSCGNCSDSNTIWVCYWEDENGQPASTCSSMANATLCESFNIDESNCIALSAKGTRVCRPQSAAFSIHACLSSVGVAQLHMRLELALFLIRCRCMCDKRQFPLPNTDST